MNTVKVRDIEIGVGTPKIVVPICGVTREEVLTDARGLKDLPLDVVEWRADWFEEVFHFDAVESILRELREVLGNTPLLMTFRTAREGGEKDIASDDYEKLNLATTKTGYVDMIDVELYSGDAIVQRIIEGAHADGVKVIASNHDFHKTPSADEMIARLLRMQELGADILKMAVMPENPQDVLTLLSATEKLVSAHATQPVVTMSMGGTGVISRLCGQVFGSAMTFGAAGKASAPGQIGVQNLNQILTIIGGSLDA